MSAFMTRPLSFSFERVCVFPYPTTTLTRNVPHPHLLLPQDVPDTSASKYKGVGWSKSHTQRQGIPALPTSANPAPVYDVSGMTPMGRAGRTDSQDLPYMRAKPAPFSVRSWIGPNFRARLIVSPSPVFAPAP